jgi:hypothetical protein
LEISRQTAKPPNPPRVLPISPFFHRSNIPLFHFPSFSAFFLPATLSNTILPAFLAAILAVARKKVGCYLVSADWTQIEERIHFAAGLRKGLYELDRGEGIAHSAVKEECAKWLSK